MSGCFNYIGKVTFDIKKFNQECERQGFVPFPIESYEIDVQDEQHFKISMKNLQQHLSKWWDSQSKKR